jgi:hypothetical protein
VSENETAGAEVRPVNEEQTAEEAFACNKALIDRLREQHGDIEVLRQKGLPGVIVVATPPRAPYRTFLDQVANDKVSNSLAAEGLAFASVVHPDRETLKIFFEKKPGLPMKIAGLAGALSGADADVLGKD